MESSHIDSALPKTNVAPEKWWLGDDQIYSIDCHKKGHSLINPPPKTFHITSHLSLPPKKLMCFVPTNEKPAGRFFFGKKKPPEPGTFFKGLRSQVPGPIFKAFATSGSASLDEAAEARWICQGEVEEKNFYRPGDPKP